MALHRLNSIIIGVPSPAETIAYYNRIRPPGRRRWMAGHHRRRKISSASSRPPTRAAHRGPDRGPTTSTTWAAAAAAVCASARRFNPPAESPASLVAHDAATGVPRGPAGRGPPRSGIRVPVAEYNGPGRQDRTGARAPGILRSGPGTAPQNSRPCRPWPPTGPHRYPPPSFPRRARLQSQRLHQGRRSIPALLHRPPQTSWSSRAPVNFLPPHLLAGRRHR